MGVGDWLSQKLNQGPEGDRADYASGAGSDRESKADKKGTHQNNLLAGQRGANGRWGTDKSPSKSMTRWSGDTPGQDNDED